MLKDVELLAAPADLADRLNMVFKGTEVVQGNGPKMIAALADFYDSLNPTQQQKVRDFMQRRHGWFSRG